MPRNHDTANRPKLKIILGGSPKKSEYERAIARIARLSAAGFDTRAYALAFRLMGGKK